MSFRLQPAHRLARITYLPRTVSFAYTFVVVLALYGERGYHAWDLVFAVLSFLVYPHLVYLHTRVAPDSKQAELNNLYLDALLLGVWVAQLRFALSPSVMVLIAVTLNSTAIGGAKRLFWTSLCFFGAAAVWGAALGYRFEFTSGVTVRTLSIFGMFVYVGWIGIIVFVENKVLARVHERQKDAERQFLFLAEHPSETVSILDTQGRFLYASPSHLKYFDASLFSSGSLWLGLIHPDDHERALEFLGKVAATHTRRRVRLRVVPQEGPPRYVECVGSPTKDYQDEVMEIVVVTQRLDVSSVGQQRE